MTICQGTLFSMLVAVGLVAAAVDTVGSGPDALQVITFDSHEKTVGRATEFRPIIDVIHDFAPQATIEILARTRNRGELAEMYILVRHPNLQYLENSSTRLRTSNEWARALSDLELAGHRLATSAIFLDRTPD